MKIRNHRENGEDGGRARATAARHFSPVLALVLGISVAACSRSEAPQEEALPPASAPIVAATPRAVCGPGSRPETDIQGRITPQDHDSGRVAAGFSCNAELVGSYTGNGISGTLAGYKVERYVDAAGRECAYYDTTILFPANILGPEMGVNVLDMSDPAKPVLATRLLSLAMLSPHESLVLNQKRGLLMAVMGNPLTAPGIVDVYDISQDCRRPILKSSALVGFLGHESGVAPDGNTFYSSSNFISTLTAVDVSDPASPSTLAISNYYSHGLELSDDGNRAYVASAVTFGTPPALLILDTSEVQARKRNPKIKEITRFTWRPISVPQGVIPITLKGRPHLLEFDEFGGGEEVGAARIIDIADEENPRVISNLRLEVHNPEHFDTIRRDNAASNGGYAAHYCSVPTRVDPTIVACSMITSGLRVFDIRDPLRPREVAYFNAPLPSGPIPVTSNWAMSRPSFVPERKEIWYTDANIGFFAVRLTHGAWP